jgi:hypothetical protein
MNRGIIPSQRQSVQRKSRSTSPTGSKRCLATSKRDTSGKRPFNDISVLFEKALIQGNTEVSPQIYDAVRAGLEEFTNQYSKKPKTLLFGFDHEGDELRLCVSVLGKKGQSSTAQFPATHMNPQTCAYRKIFADVAEEFELDYVLL